MEWDQNNLIDDRSKDWRHSNLKERISELLSREKLATNVVYRI